MAKKKGHIVHQKSDEKAQSKPNRGQGRNIAIEELGYEVLLVREYDAVKINSLINYAVVIIEYHIPHKADTLIKKIRASVVEEVYLMPIFILAFRWPVQNTSLELADGKLDGLDLKPFKEHIERIKSYVDEFKEIKTDFVGKNLLLKLLRYMLSRDKTLKPIPTHSSLTGYSYPFLEASIDDDQYNEIHNIFSAATERGFLIPNFIDLVHLCSNCHSGFVNYREICPKCQSIKLNAQHSIHHFVCGYVGPESDFFHDKKLICPKCSRQVRHIGVDYDKPSVIQECENGHVFQEPEMVTFCFRCQQENDLNTIVDYQINEYSISNTGIGVARSGENKKDEPVEIQGIITYPLFKTLVKLEGERQKITNSSIAVSYVNFLMSTETLKKQVNNYKEFIIDIITLFRNLLKPTDIIAVPVEDIILVFSAESNAIDTKKRLGVTLSKVRETMTKNGKLNSEDQMMVHSFDLTQEIGAEGVFELINDEVNIQ